MLTIKNVSKTFNKGTVNEKKALQHLNLHLLPGDFATVIGGNGAGKSTLMKCLFGIYEKNSGKILLDGVEVNFKGCQSIRGRSILEECFKIQ